MPVCRLFLGVSACRHFQTAHQHCPTHFNSFFLVEALYAPDQHNLASLGASLNHLGVPAFVICRWNMAYDLTRDGTQIKSCLLMLSYDESIDDINQMLDRDLSTLKQTEPRLFECQVRSKQWPVPETKSLTIIECGVFQKCQWPTKKGTSPSDYAVVRR